MTDPFEALREPVTPADPDPDFARQLRQRLTREVFTPAGGAMSQQTTSQQAASQQATSRQAGAPRGEPAPPPPALTPYIVVSDARRAVDWYVEVLGGAAPRRVSRQRGRHHRPRRGGPGRRGADARRGLRSVARGARPGAGGPHDVQPHPAPGGRGRRRDDRTGPAWRCHGGAGADRSALRARLGHHRPVRAPVDAAAAAGSGRPDATGRRGERDHDGSGSGPGPGVLRGRTAGAVLLRPSRARGGQRRLRRRWASGRPTAGRARCSCRSGSTTSRRPCNGSGRRAGQRTGRCAGRSGCTPSASTTRA